MVETGNECQHTAYVSPHVKLYHGGLMYGSVVPAKFLLGCFTRCLRSMRHPTRWLSFGLEKGAQCVPRNVTRHRPSAHSWESHSTPHPGLAVCIQAKEVLRTPSTHWSATLLFFDKPFLSMIICFQSCFPKQSVCVCFLCVCVCVYFCGWVMCLKFQVSSFKVQGSTFKVHRSMGGVGKENHFSTHVLPRRKKEIQKSD